MRGLFALYKALTKSWLRSRSGLFFSFLFPLMLLLIFGTIFGGQISPTYSLHILNRDLTPDGEATELSQALIAALNATGTFDITLAPHDIAPLEYIREQTRPFSGRVRLLIIPQGFQDAALNASIKSRMSVMVSTIEWVVSLWGSMIPESARTQMERGMVEMERFNATLPAAKGELTLYLDPSDTGGQSVAGIIRGVVDAFTYRLIGASPSIEVKQESYLAKQFRAADYYLPGYIAAFIMANGVIGVTNTVTDLKRRGIVKRLAITPLRKATWVLANILSQTTLAILLTLVMMAVAWAVFQVQALPGPLAWLTIFLGAVLFTGMGMLIGGLVRDVEAATGLGNAIAFPMMFLSGAFWPLEIMPEFLQAAARFLPLTYFANALRFTMILQQPLAALPSIGIIAILAAFFIGLAAKATRWREP